MLRRLLAALLVAAIAMPMPALAAGGCPMSAPTLAPERCNCCATADTATEGCASPQAGCGCSLRADTGNTPVPAASTGTRAPQIVMDVTIIPAALSTPQREQRVVHRAASPPGAGAVSRPRLCSWII